jgi:DNA-binding PadR family transcriptional regulator
MIELAILGLLREQDLHGYELRRRISDLAGLKPAVSFGALYPALGRLEGAAAVKAVEAATEPAPAVPLPPTGSLAGEAAAFLARRRGPRRDRGAGPGRSGRARKVYGITDQGEQLLVELLDDPATDERSFSLKVAFCRYLTPQRRLELFERRRADLAGRLAGERTSRRTMGDRLDLYLRSLREHDHQTIQHDIAWLDGLISNERAALSGAADLEEDTTS